MTRSSRHRQIPSMLQRHEESYPPSSSISRRARSSERARSLLLNRIVAISILKPGSFLAILMRAAARKQCPGYNLVSRCDRIRSSLAHRLSRSFLLSPSMSPASVETVAACRRSNHRRRQLLTNRTSVRRPLLTIVPKVIHRRARHSMQFIWHHIMDQQPLITARHHWPCVTRGRFRHLVPPRRRLHGAHSSRRRCLSRSPGSARVQPRRQRTRTTHRRRQIHRVHRCPTLIPTRTRTLSTGRLLRTWELCLRQYRPDDSIHLHPFHTRTHSLPHTWKLLRRMRYIRHHRHLYRLAAWIDP